MVDLNQVPEDSIDDGLVNDEQADDLTEEDPGPKPPALTVVQEPLDHEEGGEGDLDPDMADEHEAESATETDGDTLPEDESDGPVADEGDAPVDTAVEAADTSEEADEATPETAPPAATSEAVGSRGARLDRSGGVLRLPPSLLDLARGVARVESVPNLSLDNLTPPPSAEALAALQPIQLEDGTLEPMAAELLQVINMASLLVSIDLTYGPDASNPVLWATPRLAVATHALDADTIELRPLNVTQLPQVIGQLLVLRSPVFVGEAPISVPQTVLAEAIEQTEREAALELLADSGLDPYSASLLMELQMPNVRRWRITSTWSTNTGPAIAELAGIDAGSSGQWLATGTQAGDDGIVLTYIPQADGNFMAALRKILPRLWTSEPLNPLPA